MRSSRILMAIAAISFLLVVLQTVDVTRKVLQLRKADFSQTQASLMNTEVEFLNFQNQVTRAEADPSYPLQPLRRAFSKLTVSYELLEEEVEQDARPEHMQVVPVFMVTDRLQDIAARISAPENELRQGLPDLVTITQEIAPLFHQISIAHALNNSKTLQAQRDEIATTLIVLAGTSGLLMATLLLLAFYFNALNRRSETRRRQVIEASQRTRAVISTSLDAVIVSNEDGIIEEFNNAATEIFGYDREFAIGKKISELIVPGRFVDAHERAMERIRQHGPYHVANKGRVRLEAKRSNGEIFPIELALQKGELRRRRFFIAFIRDISFRVRAEQDLIEARDQALSGEKAKSQFLAVMSHEIRTPLNGVLGNLSLLKETELNANQQAYVDNMTVSGKLLLDHVNDVLEIARYEAGKPILRRRPTQILELAHAVLDSLREQASDRGNTLECYCLGPVRDWVNTDPGRIQQILINLVSNAIKFTKDGQITVEIIAEPDSDDVEFRVTDTGIGISEADQGRIFDDFVTSDSTYNREAGGTGLGLGIVKRIVLMLKGEIGSHSKLGEGSTFWVRIPMSSADAPTDDTALPSINTNPAAPSAALTASKSLDILVVEDNEINRSVVREMLKRYGHNISEAHDGQSGVDAAHAHRYDLILMDISMPVLDGREATRRIREGDGASNLSPIIALTAHVLPENVTEFLDDGMQDVLPKPLMRADLERIIEKFTETNTTIASPSAALEPVAPEKLLINLDTNTTLKDSMGDAYGPLLGKLTEELTDLAHWLENEADDMIEIAERCHKFASSAAIFGAERLRGLLIELEIAGRAGNHHMVSLRRELLPDLLEQTLERLTHLGDG